MFIQAPKSIGEITRYIGALLDRDETLADVWITGEISNMSPASSGHWYFTLKDSAAQLRCVMFRSAAARQSFTPRNGDAVEAHGKIAVYEARGEYQLYADLIRPVGMGDLYLQFERLKAKLAAEGLFDAERKRPYPLYPYRIGVVTSPTAAAFQDVLNVLRRRFPLAEVILSPTLVQGDDAPPQIVRALECLNAYSKADVILLIRGGGSIEDLWAFNDERVARAVAASRIPVVTGVGHETDFTIVDFVSDERAPTPSAAAERITPDIETMRQVLDDEVALLDSLMDELLADRRQQLLAAERTLTYVSPQVSIHNTRERLQEFDRRLMQAQRAQVALLRERLSAREAALRAANPEALLKRGYAIITRSDDGRRVTSELDVQPGVGITARVRDGEIKARVEDKELHEHYKRTLF